MASAFVQEQISSHKIVVFSKTFCPFSKKAKAALVEVGAENYDYVVFELDKREDGQAILDVLAELTGAKTVPRVFIGGKCIGGGDETNALKNSGELAKMVQN